MSQLGEQLFVNVISVTGVVSVRAGKELVQKIMEKIDMHPAHSAILYEYPVDGKGGVGFTLIQPITESFIAFDSWPDLNGAYLVICSCLEFAHEEIKVIIEKFGLTLKDNKLCGVSIR